ncbi:MAG TPA: acyl carrier protein [Opitutaceae bacterium]|nr:acyl carrier protein [Opitutaceae bacterium]
MTAAPEKTPEEKLREKLEPFPPEFQELIWDYRRTRTAATLEKIVRGMLEYHGGDVFRTKYAEKQDGVLLVEDLGFDSLALVEISFQAEEFVGIVIQLEDFPKIKTLGDLQAFLREKSFPAAAAS